QVLSRLISCRPPEESHPLFTDKGRKSGNVKIVLITGDKGLCGAYNNNIIKKVVEFIQVHANKNVKLILVGKKGNTYFSKGNYASAKERYIPEPVEKFGYDKVQALAAQLIEGYEKGEFGELHIFFTKFHTVMQSFAMGIRLLPLEKDTFDSKGKLVGEYIIEPSVDQILEHLFPKYIETQIYQCILESLTSEFAARRVAMIAATENAGEMIDELTHTYNKARQEAITKELLEVISGAEALVR
ncbi:MAG: ATP synthase F1 subunit gamma, partial [Planctomycetota bacterium]